MNIVLIGYRGTGKSTVGKSLAARLDRRLVSTDDQVVTHARLSIPEIVQQFGWEHFRDLESDVCKDIATKDNLIIDTGGGAILRPQNVEWLKQNGILFWLTAEVPTLTTRIGGDFQRPSLTGTKSFLEEIQEVLMQREPAYRAAAHHVIPTDGRPITEVTDDILAKLRAG
ncbi:MAG: shikimate kinase [Nitrospiraceae bacterium]